MKESEKSIVFKYGVGAEIIRAVRAFHVTIPEASGMSFTYSPKSWVKKNHSISYKS